jgi:type I restriction enzyme S subunit
METTRKPVGELLDPLPRQPKIKRSEYQKSGRFPIVDQSQADIAGYTDEESWLYQGELPVVIFGDHTRVLKFVDFPFCVGADGTQLLRPVPGNDVRYLYYALRNVDLTNYGYERHFKYLKEEKIPAPLLPVQRRIAGILSAYDDLMENNRRRIRLLEAMARTIFREWFVHPCQAGKLPKGWEVKPLGDVVDDIVDYRGKTPAKLNGDWSSEGILALSALNVKAGRLVKLEKSRFVDEDLYARWMKNPLRRGDILMTSEAPLGELFFLCKEARYCLSQRLYSIRANPRVMFPVILYLSLESEQTQHELNSRATGATVGGIRQSELRKVSIVVGKGY